ncbi:hypothetical protein DDZ13_02350 [Coraliomargarita sinensis]|uniref:Uncharacterized protein n=1 Tax=Coraliomargarita sinensis TaxID=2174842 RepID=A0A317ZQP0_9BACT|nr:hypothetical protein DDZ13_02350 [Coraliomargarita sinensis]
MTVTQFSKTLGVPDCAHWPSELPDGVFGFRIDRSDFETPLQAGDNFHSAFNRHIAGENIEPPYNTACLAVENALSDFGVVEVDSEIPVRGSGLSGQIDIVGRDDSGRPVLVELKSTLGSYGLKPRPSEVIQLGTYAFIQGSLNPRLMWLRVGLRSSCVSVFAMRNSAELIEAIAHSIPSLSAA